MNVGSRKSNGCENNEESHGKGGDSSISNGPNQETIENIEEELGWAFEAASNCLKVLEENASQELLKDPRDETVVRMLTEIEIKEMGIEVQTKEIEEEVTNNDGLKLEGGNVELK
ncbi:hypothetical protein RIF29_16530 [Crotalaria pallida]|uniref:Uncharacterized protein n=1 Tax=Crotalaria pallida TaxID=3830 RepID=A0AAN9FFF1_CROPI